MAKMFFVKKGGADENLDLKVSLEVSYVFL